MTVAEIIINRPTKHLQKCFSYRIPTHMEYITPGWRVIIPWGNGHEEGIVWETRPETSEDATLDLKSVFATIGDTAWFTSEMLALAEWIASYYVCPLIEALRLFLVDKKTVKSQTRYTLTISGQKKIALENIPANHQKPLKNYFPNMLEALANGWIKGELKRLSDSRFASEVVWDAAIDPVLSQLMRTPRQQELVFFLTEHPEQTSAELNAAGFSAALRKSAVSNGYISTHEKCSAHTVIRDHLPSLTSAQEQALANVTSALNEKRHETFLLHGVTASGKTEIYLRAAATAIEKGKNVLVLVPEISLTDQLVRRFTARFGAEKIFCQHSGLTERERFDNWRRVRAGRGNIVIGPRSAIFMPAEDIGLIVIDEEYDASYKQSEQTRYHARRVAEWRASWHHCPLVLGAATPSMESYYRAENGEITTLLLPERIGGVSLPKMHIVDMRSELEAGNRSILSRELYQTMQTMLSQGRQIILLLNRRGYATHVSCRTCGYVLTCPHCDLPYTYHLPTHTLQCHRCGGEREMPTSCPNCGSKAIKYFGLGTQRAQKVVAEAFPRAKVLRLDTDSAGNARRRAEILDTFAQGKADILLGTQLVAKGHDIPNVGCVGVLSIDALLNRPQYNAAEQAFQLVVQAAGRAGRKDGEGRVIVQTYHPGHYALQAACTNEWQNFYTEELELREYLHYPPFFERAKISAFAESQEKAQSHLQVLFDDLVNVLAEKGIEVEYTDIYPDYQAKLRGRFYMSFQIAAKSLDVVRAHMKQSALWQVNGIIIDMEMS